MPGQFIHRYSLQIIIVILLLTAYSVANFSKLETDTGFKGFFPANEPELYTYEILKERTGTSENHLVIAIRATPTAFNRQFQLSLQTFQQKLDSIPNIESVQSLLTLKRYRQAFPGIIEEIPYLHIAEQNKWKGDSIMIYRDFALTQQFISRNARVIKIHLLINEHISLPAMDSLTREIDHAALNFRNYRNPHVGKKIYGIRIPEYCKQRIKNFHFPKYQLSYAYSFPYLQEHLGNAGAIDMHDHFTGSFIWLPGGYRKTPDDHVEPISDYYPYRRHF